MPPVRVVKRDVRAAYRHAKRLGNTAGLNRLERHQPDLTEYLLDTVSGINADLARSRLSRAQVRRLTRQIEILGVVLVDAVFLAHRHQPPLPSLVIPPLA